MKIPPFPRVSQPLARRVVAWTKEVPSETGFFWWRRDARAHATIALVDIPNAVAIFSRYRDAYPLATVCGEWWPTPITLPERAE